MNVVDGLGSLKTRIVVRKPFVAGTSQRTTLLTLFKTPAPLMSILNPVIRFHSGRTSHETSQNTYHR